MLLTPDVAVPLGGITMILGIVLGLPIVRAYARRVEARPAPNTLGTGEIVSRLDRIEQAVEAMSTEIERISEGQRFTTKLLSESNRTQQALPAAQAAAQTPQPQTTTPEPLPDGTILSPAARRS